MFVCVSGPSASPSACLTACVPACLTTILAIVPPPDVGVQRILCLDLDDAFCSIEHPPPCRSTLILHHDFDDNLLDTQPKCEWADGRAVPCRVFA